MRQCYAESLPFVGERDSSRGNSKYKDPESETQKWQGSLLRAKCMREIKLAMRGSRGPMARTSDFILNTLSCVLGKTGSDFCF